MNYFYYKDKGTRNYSKKQAFKKPGDHNGDNLKRPRQNSFAVVSFKKSTTGC
ncbi:hypothetical protein FC81_GL000172 [Liquorilactobacillus capillatus DSM 19910]|uniref:Uncharacterized protein n=1 Tax=Liquorilactobacillus capillatus DSM 19910 TaxID=1423731 RepID=A0A0R1MDG2_9LACO|nr:hypothetical protein FC81_GL000172 [Liquorilactobacillus capillatus DSM 19910]